MSDPVDITEDKFESVGAVAGNIVQGRRGERDWNGQPISEPGIYRKIPMDAYHGQLTVGPSISSSGLREIENRSPLHYFATSYLNPDRPEDEASTPSLDFGRAVHTLLLSEDGFQDDYVVRPEKYEDDEGKWKAWNGNATVCKEWLAGARKAGKTVLLKSQVSDIHGMAERLAKNQVAVDLLRGRIERSIITKDAKTGVWVKSRPDSIPRDTIIADLKTCADASQVAIGRSIINYGYLQQMALAITCLEEVGQRQVNESVLLFVETSYPYAFNIKPLDNGDIHTAMRQNRRALNVFAECLKANDWPTYLDNMRTWSAPQWWSDRNENDPTLPALKGKAA
ncbi:PD-(D/E)XK nuclease-like domain-containing protein [Mesorhizobium sp. B263B2A]|uniref:PD-(D/E)XK nuclease-like domain-containing protein n=1 Tax=Mesorhizobium sp. B263B2A TaxID=2876669 RepID=UPI001CD163B0|nr:PD-(D/E)XK nuclease-like domain-containing protein [Mesorhizobium sp. B263B2A]MCA0032706.1 PD-(D/E)XK nuclease-like domain-containing protein [Mesorhizobium sp. B263B2A]